MAKAEVKVDVTDAVNAHIRAAIAEALGKDPAALVQKVVDTAMQARSRHFSDVPLFTEAVHDMIRDEARVVFKEWLDEQRPLIRGALLKRLSEKPAAFIDTIADKLVNALADAFYVSISIKVED